MRACADGTEFYFLFVLPPSRSFPNLVRTHGSDGVPGTPGAPGSAPGGAGHAGLAGSAGGSGAPGKAGGAGGSGGAGGAGGAGGGTNPVDNEQLLVKKRAKRASVPQPPMKHTT